MRVSNFDEDWRTGAAAAVEVGEVTILAIGFFAAVGVLALFPVLDTEVALFLFPLDAVGAYRLDAAINDFFLDGVGVLQGGVDEVEGDRTRGDANACSGDDVEDDWTRLTAGDEANVCSSVDEAEGDRMRLTGGEISVCSCRQTLVYVLQQRSWAPILIWIFCLRDRQCCIYK